MLSAPTEVPKVSVWLLGHRGPEALARNQRQPWHPVSGKQGSGQPAAWRWQGPGRSCRLARHWADVEQLLETAPGTVPKRAGAPGLLCWSRPLITSQLDRRVDGPDRAHQPVQPGGLPVQWCTPRLGTGWMSSTRALSCLRSYSAFSEISLMVSASISVGLFCFYFCILISENNCFYSSVPLLYSILFTSHG